MNDAVIRKAAMVVASLQPREADALLDRFPDEQAQRIRLAVMDLGTIDDREQQQALSDFFQDNSDGPITPSPSGPLGNAANSPNDASYRDAGVVLQLSSASQPTRAARLAPEDRSESTCVQDQDDDGLHDLAGIPGPDLAGLLCDEHPQTVAMIVAHLNPQQAAATLQAIPARRQTEVLRRVARLNQPHPEIVREVGRAVHARIARLDPPKDVAQAGLAALNDILQATDQGHRRLLVDQLVHADSQLAVHLSPQSSDAPPRAARSSEPLGDRGRGSAQDSSSGNSSTNDSRPATPVHGTRRVDERGRSFDDLEQLSDEDLARILHAADPDVTVIALTGASHSFVQRILSHLPVGQAAQLQTQMEQIGPLQLADVERAQQCLLRLAENQLSAGLSEPAPGQRFAVAA